MIPNLMPKILKDLSYKIGADFQITQEFKFLFLFLFSFMGWCGRGMGPGFWG